MKGLLAMFTLTPREQRLVVFIVLALVAGVAITYRRDNQTNDKSAPRESDLTLPAEASPKPNQ